jgi:L,D-transpeptidase catalytic domain
VDRDDSVLGAGFGRNPARNLQLSATRVRVLPALPPPPYLVARPTAAAVALRASPSGPVVTTLGSRGLFGGPLELSVVRRSGRWLGVTSEALPNGRLGWIDARRGVAVSTTRIALSVDLAAHRLTVLRGGRVLRRIPVAIGRASSPTPVGRFAVTEKLPGARYSSAAYGCCILALSGHQPHPPAGWNPNEDWRLAIHGGAPGAVSAGCIHADEATLRFLMRVTPLGTPVTVSA